jgi:hypothetical protein
MKLRDRVADLRSSRFGEEAITLDAGRILVVCKGDRSLEIIDLERGRSTGGVVASGDRPREVAASRDGTVGYVPVYSDAGVGAPGSDGRAIDIIDLVRARTMATVEFPFASRPHLPLLGPDGMLYVSTELDESLSVFDPRTMRLVRQLATGPAQSHMFAFSPDGRTIAVANVGPGTVSVLDRVSGALRGIVEVTATVNRISFDARSRLAFTADQESPRIDMPDRDHRSRHARGRRSHRCAAASAGDRGAPRRKARLLRLRRQRCGRRGRLREPSVSRVIPTGRNPDGIAWSPRPGQRL